MANTKTSSKLAKPFTVTVETGGETYTAKGKTVDEALDALELNYTQIKTKGTITLTHGDKKATRLFYCQPLRRVVTLKGRKSQVARDMFRLLK